MVVVEVIGVRHQDGRVSDHESLASTRVATTLFLSSIGFVRVQGHSKPSCFFYSV